MTFVYGVDACYNYEISNSVCLRIRVLYDQMLSMIIQRRQLQGCVVNNIEQVCT